jgi:hypothetical protein
MRYILLEELKNADELDDGLYVVKTRVTEDTDPSEAGMEVFSEGDLYKIRKRVPSEADSIAFTDDWMFYNSVKMLFFDYVFKD